MFSSRSSESARCDPRFEDAIACTSSMMTVSTVRSIDLARLVSIRYSDSGVVIRMSGGFRSMARRSRCGVSPVLIAVVIGVNGKLWCCAYRSIPKSGTSRFFSMS
ncbi:hypothetical protein BMS3Bbin02_00866 [bacterium BMS3Bbin02]|nr:hypothetical protein BMS3Bbin02_00866 [bacterium BMS3Bbin02]